jgi:hypothetical protein
LKKELNVETPFNAIEKWFEINPKIFKENPLPIKSIKLQDSTILHRNG